MSIIIYTLLLSFSLPCTAQEEKLRILVGSPIRQKPKILREFLISLSSLDQTLCTLDYCFVNDNIIDESHEILNDFAKMHAGHCQILLPDSAQEKGAYISDDVTHVWTEKTMWKVGGFKDRIIEVAKQDNYDYLFLIDSDLLINSITITHLIKTKKDIISNIFWTRWKPHVRPAPQVWMFDEYSQYERGPCERLSKEEQQKRCHTFLTKLKEPGTYEVGGLGACTLISKHALDTGVNFKHIKNLSFWGEDRHFCIRAVALGLSLHVDTHYPAYHVFREAELAGVPAFKEKNNIISKAISSLTP